MSLTTHKNISYTLSFYEALQAVMNGSWAQGEHFADGVIIMGNGSLSAIGRDHAHIHNFTSGVKSDLKINKRLSLQRFRLVNDQADALRKIPS